MIFALWSSRFSDDSFEKLTTRFTPLFNQLLSIMMLFLGVNHAIYYHSEPTFITVAAYSGALYASLAAIDSFYRARYSCVRIFADLSVIAGIVCATSLGLILFKIEKIAFDSEKIKDKIVEVLRFNVWMAIFCVVSALIAIVSLWLLFFRRETDTRLQELVERDIDVNILIEITISELINHPKKKETEMLYQNLLRRLGEQGINP